MDPITPDEDTRLERRNVGVMNSNFFTGFFVYYYYDHRHHHHHLLLLLLSRSLS